MYSFIIRMREMKMFDRGWKAALESADETEEIFRHSESLR